MTDARRFSVVALLWASALAACAAPAPAGSLDATVPDSSLPDSAVPVGGGVCCPRDTPSCDCTALGGWAPSLDECNLQGICDAWPPDFTEGVDSHGCPYWSPGGSPESGCCLCLPEDGGL